MLIDMRKSVASMAGAFTKGKRYDVEASLAQQFITNGWALPVREAPETAMQAPEAQQAMLKRPRGRPRKQPSS